MPSGGARTNFLAFFSTTHSVIRLGEIFSLLGKLFTYLGQFLIAEVFQILVLLFPL
jgi:hypothetical protein